MKNNLHTISIASDFSKFPGGRNEFDGHNNAQRFKKEVLLPALEKYDHIVIDFEGIAGVGSSFLEETFGGLIRDDGYTADEIYGKIEFATRQGRIDEIKSYIDDAQKIKESK